MDDEDHEAYGAMIHRQLVAERRETRDKYREALDMAIDALERISKGDDAIALFAERVLENIKEILK